MRKSIPDLREDHDEITLDHCYVLIAYLGRAFDLMEGTEDSFKDLAAALNPEVMRDELQYYFKAPEFSRLFNSEMGKGVLVGVFAKTLLDRMNGDEE